MKLHPVLKKQTCQLFKIFIFRARKKKIHRRGPVGLGPGGNVALVNQRQSRWPFQVSQVPGGERPPHTCSVGCTWGVVDASVPPGASTRDRRAAPRFPPPAPRPPCPRGARDESRQQPRSRPPSPPHTGRHKTGAVCSAALFRWEHQEPFVTTLRGGWVMCPTYVSQAPASLVTPHLPVPGL